MSFWAEKHTVLSLKEKQLDLLSTLSLKRGGKELKTLCVIFVPSALN